MEGELILMAIIMLIGQIILYQMYQSGWFKKENFKIQKASVMAENRIKLKSLERDLGLKHTAELKEEKSTVDTVKDWYSLLKNIEPDKLKDLADKFLTRGDEEEYEEEEDEDIVSTILKNIPKDSIKEFFEGLGKGKKEQTEIRRDNY